MNGKLFSQRMAGENRELFMDELTNDEYVISKRQDIQITHSIWANAIKGFLVTMGIFSGIILVLIAVLIIVALIWLILATGGAVNDLTGNHG